MLFIDDDDDDDDYVNNYVDDDDDVLLIKTDAQLNNLYFACNLSNHETLYLIAPLFYHLPVVNT